MQPDDHQSHEWLTSTLMASGGLNTPLGRMIADETGDFVSDRFRTLGFIDRQQRSRAFVFHFGLGGEPGVIEVSSIASGLPWSRPVLRTLAEAIFVHGEKSACLVRAPLGDAGLQALSRMTTSPGVRVGASTCST